MDFLQLTLWSALRNKQKSILEYCKAHPSKLPKWTELYFLRLRDCVGVLSPIGAATDVIQGSKYVTSSLYLPTLSAVRASLQPQTPIYVMQPDGSESPCSQEVLTETAIRLRQSLLQEYNSYYDDLPVQSRCLLITAAMFDPVFKDLGWLPGHVNDPKDETAMAARRKVNATFAQHCLAVYKQMFDSPPDTQDVSDAPITPTKHKSDKLFARFSHASPPADGKKKQEKEPVQGEQQKTEAWSSFQSALKQEAFAYLLAPPPMHETSPLVWWRKHGSEFPKLLVPARYFLGIPASQASTERLFSVGGRRDDQSHGRLEPTMLGRIVSAQQNLPAVQIYRNRKAVL